MGRMPPEMNRVVFGCVRPNGDVDTEATEMGVLSRLSGIEIVNGSRGTVRLKEGGAGFMTDAVARNTRVLDFEETSKDLRVMRSEAEGKGALCPG